MSGISFWNSFKYGLRDGMINNACWGFRMPFMNPAMMFMSMPLFTSMPMFLPYNTNSLFMFTPSENQTTFNSNNSLFNFTYDNSNSSATSNNSGFWSNMFKGGFTFNPTVGTSSSSQGVSGTKIDLKDIGVSQDAIDLIKECEGCVLTAYPDAGGYSIGYGHHGTDVKKGMSISQAKADEYLAKDLKTVCSFVKSKVKVKLTQNQFDALVSLTYNIGVGNFEKSSVLKYVNQGKFEEAAKAFDKHVYSKGKKLDGLVKRRNKEKALFKK